MKRAFRPERLQPGVLPRSLCLLAAALLGGCEQPASPPSLHLLGFDKNAPDAGGAMTALSLGAGSATALPANAFTRAGYDFAGWALSPSGAVAYADEASYAMGEAEAVLYAVWSAQSFSLAFDPNGGSGSMEGQSFLYGTSASLRPNAFSRAGFDFAGWARTSEGPVAYADGASYATGLEDLSLYAVWTTGVSLGFTLRPSGSGELDFDGDATLAKGETLAISVTNEDLGDFDWYLDGERLEGHWAAELELSTASLVAGPHYLMVTAMDEDGLRYSAGLSVKITN